MVHPTLRSTRDSPHTAGASAAYRGRVTTVLLVEHNDHLRSALRSRFQREGFALREASSAAQGISMARAEHPDLIVLAAALMTDDGVDFQTELRQDAALRGVPVVLLTTRARETSPAGVPREGIERRVADDPPRLEHPFRPGQLLDLVRVMVRSGHRANDV